MRDTEEGAVQWHGLDSGGFSDVPLGSPPQRTSQNMSQNNGVNPHLEQVAQSLVHLGGPNSAKHGRSSKLHQLQSENASLKERLKAVENVSLELPQSLFGFAGGPFNLSINPPVPKT